MDSSGNRLLRANGTIIDVFPVGVSLGFCGALLIALFAVIKPEASSGLDTLARVGFWSLHVGLGLTSLWLASRWLANGALLPAGTLSAVLVTGCAAIAVASPGYLMLDTLYAPYVVDTDPDSPSSSILSAIALEALELAPWFLLAWLLINLPVLLPRPDSGVCIEDAIPQETAEVNVPGIEILSNNAVARNAGPLVSAVLTGDSEESPQSLKENVSTQRFLTTLPGVVGTDVIAVASDLHYLNVWTVAGRTTVLGNLKDVTADLGHIGMQVHRSHWVAHSHVRRITGNASNAACILSNELRVPISRRRWKAVKEQYGRGVVHTSQP